MSSNKVSSDAIETIVNSISLTGQLFKNASVTFTLRRYAPNSGAYDELNDYNSVTDKFTVVHEDRRSTILKLQTAIANMKPVEVFCRLEDAFVGDPAHHFTTEVAMSTRIKINKNELHLFCADLKGKEIGAIRSGLRTDLFTGGDTFRLLETQNSFHVYSSRAVDVNEFIRGLGTLLITMGDHIDTRWVGFAIAKNEGFVRVTENTKGPITAWPNYRMAP